MSHSTPLTGPSPPHPKPSPSHTVTSVTAHMVMTEDLAGHCSAMLEPISLLRPQSPLYRVYPCACAADCWSLTQVQILFSSVASPQVASPGPTSKRIHWLPPRTTSLSHILLLLFMISCTNSVPLTHYPISFFRHVLYLLSL